MPIYLDLGSLYIPFNCEKRTYHSRNSFEESTSSILVRTHMPETAHGMSETWKSSPP